jgi:hypothetical protein
MRELDMDAAETAGCAGVTLVGASRARVGLGLPSPLTEEEIVSRIEHEMYTIASLSDFMYD